MPPYTPTPKQQAEHDRQWKIIKTARNAAYDEAADEILAIVKEKLDAHGRRHGLSWNDDDTPEEQLAEMGRREGRADLLQGLDHLLTPGRIDLFMLSTFITARS
jgi:hypothetical protein